jgi:hypothetical protein
MKRWSLGWGATSSSMKIYTMRSNEGNVGCCQTKNDVARVGWHGSTTTTPSAIDEEQPVGGSPNYGPLTRCSNGGKTTIDAMDGQQPIGECQIMGHRHFVLAAPKPSRFWWKWSLGVQEKDHHVWEYYLEEDGDWKFVPTCCWIHQNRECTCSHMDNCGLAVGDL